MSKLDSQFVLTTAWQAIAGADAARQDSISAILLKNTTNTSVDVDIALTIDAGSADDIKAQLKTIELADKKDDFDWIRECIGNELVLANNHTLWAKASTTGVISVNVFKSL